MDFQDVDFSALQDIPPVRSRFDTPRISISQKGRVCMNGAMQSKVGDRREFRAKISPDGRYLVLFLNDSSNIRFSAQGKKLHRELARYLEEKGFLMPVVYTMEWCEQHQAWVGCCRELSQPPAISVLEKPKGRGRKPGVRRNV